MNWIRSKANAIIFSLSCILALFVFELVYKYGLRTQVQHKSDARYMLFSGGVEGKVFRNVGRIFTYAPNRAIYNTTYYNVNNGWVKEYGYVIRTNNLGLVQSNDIKNNVPSLVLLGDSFTEGQGASPWFESFRDAFSQGEIQYINGGILGTGFQQWKLLHDFLLTENVNIKYLVVVFISADYLRGVWNMPQQTLNCLANYNFCFGNESFYGMPTGLELTSFLEKLRAHREGRGEISHKSAVELMKYYFPATTIVSRYIRDKYFKQQDESALSRQAVANLIENYKENVLFIHIPYKEEAMEKIISPIGKLAVADIQELGGDVYDGHTKCGLNESDYFIHDGHPNENGYAKIAACISAAVRSKWDLQ